MIAIPLHGPDRFAFRRQPRLKSAEVIKSMISNTCGFDTVNQVVRREILKWVLYAFEQYLSEPQAG